MTRLKLIGLLAMAGLPGALWLSCRAGRYADLGGGVRMEFVRIQPGEFMMGSDNGGSHEKPPHRVRITRAFELGKYEVTQRQWEAVMGSKPSLREGADCPVEGVSWNDTQEFLEKLNARGDGYRYRLPTEAEWEYAARAGTTGDYVDDLDAMAWYVNNSGRQTHPVGQKQPNAWGLYDLLGNVAEWCQDWYDENYYRNGPDQDPAGPSTGQYRTLRGRSWGDSAGLVRSAGRGFWPPVMSTGNIGFRCARE